MMAYNPARLGLILVATTAMAGELRRDGPFWVEVEKGSEAVAPHSTVRVTAIGGVTIKGTASSTLAYVLTKRVKARNEAQARRLLRGFGAHISRRGSYTYLVTRSAYGMADLDVTAPRNLSQILVETRGGAVDASQFDGVVKVETGGGLVALDQISGDVVAKTAGGDITLGKLGGEARCISGGGTIRADSIRGEAFFETAAGDITVQEVNGPVRCSTNGGAIRIVQAGDVVIADTGGGPIDVGHAKGMVTAKNSGGPIQVHSSSGAACETAGGAIRLTSDGGSLKASTAVGSIIARFQSQPAADSFLSTGAGDITLWVPSNLKVTVRAQNATYGGPRKIVSDFPAIVIRSQGAFTTAEGKINGGGPLVRIAGSGGMIYIRREEK
ncbi:MAG TPA: hypothetical protein VJN43_00760 [Bryobacteraceae bacterium]|nr:hypothetical protein [Bryobacteraceae bacterium]